MMTHPLAENLVHIPLTEINKRNIPSAWCWTFFDIVDAFSDYLYDHSVRTDELQSNVLKLFDCFILEVTEEIALGVHILKADVATEE